MSRAKIKGRARSFRFTEGVFETADALARKRGKNVTEVLEELLRKWFDENGVEIVQPEKKAD